MRWIVALLLTALAVAALWPIAMRRDVEPSPGDPRDILGYQLDPARPLEVEVPAPIEALYITTWAVLADTACDPVDRSSYGVAITFLDQQGRDAGTRDFDLVSRRACDGEPATRLADATDPVADHRTLVLRTSDILPEGGRARITSRPGVTRGVIAMIEARYRRDPYAQRARELAFTPAERRRVTGKLTSLGFADLPPSARAQVAGAWSRRIDASGIDGRDYFLRRLVVRDFTTPLPATETPPTGFPIGARHFAAYNLTGAIDLDLAAPEGTRVRVRDPRGPGATIVLGPDGVARVSLPDAPLRTVVLEGDGPDVRVRALAGSQAQSLQQIGDVQRRPAPAGRVELSPDLRFVKYASLDPLRPVVARVVEGGVLRLDLRGVLAEDDPAEQLTIPLAVSWGAGPKDRVEQAITLPRSRFERWSDVADATDRARIYLRPPTTSGAVLVTGSSSGRVALKALDPRVEDLLALPYRVTLQPGETWRYPPFDLRRWVPVLPENHEELREGGRWLEAREQVRIESPGEDAATRAAQRPERALLPERNPVRRRFFAPAWWLAGQAMSGPAWTPLSSAPKSVRVPADGPTARRARLLYRAAPSALGERWTVRADGAAVRSEKMALTSGTADIPLDPGVHALSVEAPSGALFFVDAAPEGGGEVVRERTVFELTKAAPLDFRFSQAAGEPLTLILFVVTEGAAKPWSLRFAIDGGEPSLLFGRFFHAITVPRGQLASDDLARAPRGFLWESPVASADPRDAAGIAKIRLGDDLDAGRRAVRVELAGAETPVWIAAVLFGQAPPPAKGSTSVWVEESE